MNLPLSFAIGGYDRHQALLDGRVKIDGVDPVFMALSPEEIFFRAMRQTAFDVCELSLSSYVLRTARGDCPYIGVPVFLSRAFRHSSIIVRADSGIHTPQDLIGKRVGTPEWQLTANVWTRAFLADDFDVHARQIHWFRGGLEEAGRVEKVKLTLADDIRVDDIGPEQTLRDMLASGEIDAFIGPRAPSSFVPENTELRWLFADPTAAATDFYQRTQIFPIMHLLGVRRELAEAHPWLPVALQKAFGAAKTMALDALSDTSATKVTLPFVEEQLRRAQQLLGADFWRYGVAGNEQTLDYFLRHHHEQGLSSRRLAISDLFHPSTFESYRI